MQKINVGVIGVGALGRHHSRLYNLNDKCCMAGIFDVNTESAEKVGAEFGLPVFKSWQELAAKCDALSVATPATYHAATVVPLLEMGKHVLVEKPIASSVEDAVKMVEAAEANQVILAVGHVERFNPSLAILDLFPGKIRFIEAQRIAKYPPSRPGLPPRGTEVSVTLDLMIHDIDLVLSLVDSEVESIDVSGSPVLSPGDDIVSARINFVNGCTACLTASRIAQNPKRMLRLYRENDYLSIDLNNHSAARVGKDGGELKQEVFDLPEKNALACELDDFVRSVIDLKSGKTPAPKISGRAGLAALKLAVDIELAAKAWQKKFAL